MYYKVFIKFRDGKEKIFYAVESYNSTANGRILYWIEKDTMDIRSYPVEIIEEIIEQEIPE